MGIESLQRSSRRLEGNYACKKSPQAWGLKVSYDPHQPYVDVSGLQKESPSMGIESPDEPFNSIHVHGGLQKESPSMGIESSETFSTLILSA